MSWCSSSALQAPPLAGRAGSRPRARWPSRLGAHAGARPPASPRRAAHDRAAVQQEREKLKDDDHGWLPAVGLHSQPPQSVSGRRSRALAGLPRRFPGPGRIRVRRSCVINGAGNTTVVFLSTPISTRRLQVAQLQRQRVRHHGVRGFAERGGGQRLAFGGDDFRPLLPFCLGLAGHRPLHAVGQLDVFELDQGDLHAPLGGRDIEDLTDVEIDLVGLGKRLIQGVLADDLAQRRLGDLVDRRLDFSIATTDFTASTTRKYATAETSTLTLSRVMIPCDWIGIVTIRSDTRCSTSTNGTMNRKPGSLRRSPGPAGTRRLLVLFDDPHRHRQHQQ